MNPSTVEKVGKAGVVGAGGAGFPTHIKISCRAEVVLANGMECEPLLRVDRQMMERHAPEVINGMKAVMEHCGARKGVICLKRKYHQAVKELSMALADSSGIELFLSDSFYPAGDEQQLVYAVTGRVVPAGGIPPDVGAVVLNVSTLVNISNALDGIPVTSKTVTVAGEVGTPVTLAVPIGTPVRKLVEAARGPEESAGYSLVIGGPLMGQVTADWDTPVTKTTSGVIVLPADHRLIIRKTKPLENDYRLIKSACCQCNYCTQMCPRNALGLRLEPHKVMRAVGYGDAGALGDANAVFACCDCGICTFYACPMELSPGRMVTAIKNEMARKGIKPVKRVPRQVSGEIGYKRVPLHRLADRVGISKYDVEAPLREAPLEVGEVRIPLKQHIGVPAVPVVKAGDSVKAGDPIGEMPEGKMGANVHASISGTVIAVDGDSVRIIR